jgi:hypothetical protein
MVNWDWGYDDILDKRCVDIIRDIVDKTNTYIDIYKIPLHIFKNVVAKYDLFDICTITTTLYSMIYHNNNYFELIDTLPDYVVDKLDCEIINNDLKLFVHFDNGVKNSLIFFGMSDWRNPKFRDEVKKRACFLHHRRLLVRMSREVVEQNGNIRRMLPFPIAGGHVLLYNTVLDYIGDVYVLTN